MRETQHLAKTAGQQFDRVKDLPPHSRKKLLVTRNATGYERTRATFLISLPDLCEQVFPDRHTQLVIFSLVAKAARHPATLDRRGDDIKAGGSQDLDGLCCRTARSLLAMRMVEKPGSLRTATREKNPPQVELMFLRYLPEVLQRLKAILRQ